MKYVAKEIFMDKFEKDLGCCVAVWANANVDCASCQTVRRWCL